MRILPKLLAVALLSGLFFVDTAPVAAAPPMPDPKAMSGVPRVDPQVPAGSVTVRVLGEGGFAEPIVGAEVTLDLIAPDGKTETRKATSQAEGRATFEGLQAFVGGSAVAKVSFDGKDVSSQAIELDASAGSRVMLVKGASTRAEDPQRAEAARVEQLVRGKALPNPETAPGHLTVLAFDFASRRPAGGVELTLTANPPEGEPIVRKGKTDPGGKAEFPGLVAPEFPAGTQITVEGIVVPGGQPRRTQPFTMDAKSGMMAMLVEGTAAEHAQGQAQGRPTQRAPLPAPRIMPKLPVGTVDVAVVDANDQPVPDQKVVLVMRTPGGDPQTYTATTEKDGIATIENVDVQAEAIYFAEANYDGGPYQTAEFMMDNRGGVMAAVRVFETTSDRSVVRSMVQFDIDPMENDQARVIQLYELVVDGDKAFWDPEGLEITAAGDPKGFTVLRPAEDWLDHEEKAPFARLAGPIPPGSIANLSVGYFIDHDGTLEIEWAPPFRTMESTIVVADEYDLDATGASKASEPPPAEGKSVHKLGPLGAGQDVSFSVGDLPVSTKLFKHVALVGGWIMALVLLVGVVTRPRQSTKQRLLTRRNALLDLLERDASKMSDDQRKRIVAALDRIVRQIEALSELEPRAPGAPPA